MIRSTIAVLAAAGVILAGSAQAGQYNKKLSVGDAAPARSNLPGVDGKTHSLADLKDENDVRPEQAKRHYLTAAVEAALHGEEPAVTEPRGRGCSVKYDRGAE